MRRLLIILFLLPLVSLVDHSKMTVQNYYFANSGTDGGACSFLSPCKTIPYLNTLTLIPGDSVKFNRGDTFQGEIIPSAAGTSANPIVYTAYGTGALPVISGFYKLVGYTNVSGNIWSAPCPSCQVTTNLVTVGGNLQAMGRTPNTGYNTVSVAGGTSYITDPTLTGTPNYSGAQLVLRINHFTETRNAINSQDGDTLFYTAANGGATAQWGYFIQNAASTLDQPGEWYWNNGTGQMEIYTTDTTVAVQVGVINTLVYAHSKNYLTFDHLAFQGANDTAVSLGTNTAVNVQNCTFTNCNEGIIGSNVSGKFTNNTATYLNDNALALTSSSSDIINNNTIAHVGESPGMGIPISSYIAMSLQTSNSEINANNVRYTGYDPINIKGTQDTANYNLIDSFDYVLDDGGGIYWYESLGQTFSGRRCIGNVIFNGMSAVPGTHGGIAGETGAVGIYTDQSSTGLEIDSNTLFDNSQAGLYIHSSQTIGARYNTIWGNTWTQIQLNHDNATYDKLRGIDITNNTIGASSTPTQYTNVSIVLTSIAADYDSVGVIDSNQYVTPSATWWTGTSTGATSLQTYTSWQSVTGTDGHSSFFQQTPNSLYYDSSQTNPLSASLPSGYWQDVHNNTYSSSVTLAPIQSLVLFPPSYPIAYGPGEYMHPGIDNNHRGFVLSNDKSLFGNGGTGSFGEPNYISSSAYMVFVIANLHNAAWLDSTGNPWFAGAAEGLPWVTGTSTYEGNTDSLGATHTFSMLATGWQAADGNYGWYAGIAKADSSLWICGDIQHGLRGIHGAAGQLSSYWVQIPTGGKKVKSIMGSWNLIVLYWDGTVSTLGNAGSYQAALGWGTPSFGQSTSSYSSNYDFLHDVGLSHIRMIAGGMDINWAIDSSNNIKAWGEYGWRLGHSTTVSADPLNTPTDVTAKFTAAGMTGTIDTVVTDGACTHFLIGAGVIWGVGSNEQGTIGNGQQVNFATYNVSPGSPYDDGGANESTGTLVQFTPVVIAPGQLFKTLYNGIYYNYFDVAQLPDGTFCGWGRDKGAVMPVMTTNIDTATTLIPGVQPNGWQRPWPTRFFNPFAFPDPIWRSTSQGCYNACTAGPVTGSPCSLVTPTCYTDHAHLTLSQSGGNLIMNASASTSTAYPVYCTFSEVSGPALNMGITDNPVTFGDTAAASPGTYTIKVVIQDPNWGADSTTQSITIGQTGYYFAASGSGTACTQSLPCPASYWNTLYSVATAGDTFYMNRGDVFQVEMVANSFGSAGNPIVVKPYGTGADPVVGGLTTLSGWTNVSGNVWEVPYTGSWLNLAVYNGALMTQARTPNLTTGYFIPTSINQTSITDAAHAGMVTTGTKIAARTSAYTIDSAHVTGVSSGVISVSPSFTYNPGVIGGDGWMIMNNTPDTVGEWQDTLGQLRVYSVGSPSGTWQAPAEDTLLLDEGGYQEWDSIDFRGGNKANVILAFQANANIAFKGCISEYGIDGYQFRSDGAVTITGGQAQHLTNDGKMKVNANNYNEYDSAITVYDIGMLPGMGRQGNQQPVYAGWVGGDSASTVVNLLVDSTGAAGIINYGSGFKVNYNSIRYWCQILEDQAAVYTWMTSGTLARWREIFGNYAHGGGSAMSHNGSALDMSASGVGIYLDNYSYMDSVVGNTIDSSNSTALYDHGPTNVFTGNLTYNSGFAAFLAYEITGGPTITGLIVSGNSFNAISSGTYLMYLETANNDIVTFGTFNNNSFNHQNATSAFYKKDNTGAGSSMNFATWKSTYSGYESTSAFAQNTLSLAGNLGFSTQAFTLPGVYKDLTGKIYYNKITLPQLSGKLLQLVNPGQWWRYRKHS